MPMAPGAVLGPYVVVAPLGAGGMGEVYRARGRALDLLDSAIRSGWGSREWLENDPDLDAIRDTHRFREILAGKTGGGEAPSDGDRSELAPGRVRN